ncbi:hypothetical protein M0R45_008521 [Rubus argutus]|uniref:Cyclic nucleotide-binding domain-containing protein n=1 Tax=Rubus argutus TaxID=59490 RepID=A0AAW1Y1W9_RUBAR
MIDLPCVIVGIIFIVLTVVWWMMTARDEKETLVVFTILGLFGIIGALPIPQIAMLVFLPRMKGSNFNDGVKIMNTLIVLQYALRVYPFYMMCKSLNKDKLDKSNKSKSYWVSGAINFVMYITACHVLGAFWYFFSLQREIDYWIHACKSENGCEISTLDCVDHKTFKNVTLLNDLCPINPSNAMIFDFGIYLDALQSGMLGSTDFPQKFLQCFSWGLRNLSSFGSNLKTSTYAWENLFVALISISGLLVFIYLLGHLQTFMQTMIRQGESLDMMFFVTQGIVLTYTINNGGSSSTSRLEKGDYYGEMLLSWAVASTSFSNVPISPHTVKSQKKVEVFAISATESQLVVAKFYSKILLGSPDTTQMKITVANS